MRYPAITTAAWLATAGAAFLPCIAASADHGPSTVADLHTLANLPGNDIASLRALATRQRHYTVYPELILNGLNTGHPLPMQLGGDHPSLQPARLRELGLALPEAYDTEWVSMRELGVQGHYQPQQQRLYLDVPAQWLPVQFRRAGNRLHRSALARSSGALLNYDLFTTRQEDGTVYSAAGHEARLFSHLGTLSSSGVVRWQDSPDIPARDNRYVRLDTFWRHTDPEQMHTYTLGDTLTGALAWSSSVRVAGAQLSRNFASRPDLITFPLPSISGSAAVPTALDIFVNDLKVGEQALQPGPFVLETTPALTGLGEVTLITTDTLGRQVASTVPFYVSPELLRPGLADYSLTLGAPRRQFGQRSADYQDTLLSSGALRYGVNDLLTVEGTASHVDTLRVAGAGVVTRLGLLGVGALAYSHSATDQLDGHQLSARYEYRRRGLGLSAQHTERTAGFRDLGNYFSAGTAVQQISQFNSYFTLPRGQGSLSASYLRTRQFDGERTDFLVMSHSRALWHRASLNFSVNQNLREREDRTFRISLNLPLGLPQHRPVSVGAGMTRHPDSRQSVVSLRRPAQQFWDLGWDLAKGFQDDSFSRAHLDWRTPYAQFHGGAFERDSDTTLFGGVTGSLAYAGGGLFAANRIGDSFAVVDTGGFAGVPVRQSNQLVGHSNRQGHLLLPNLVPFSPNRISIDIDTLPVDALVAQPVARITPADLSGVVVHFDITQQHSALLTLVDDQGAPVPPGRPVRLPNGRNTVTGHGGEVFATALRDGTNSLHVVAGNAQTCIATFEFSSQAGTLQRLGTFTCQRIPPVHLDTHSPGEGHP
ncbi:type 1 pili usher protein CsuD [Alcanivorax sp. S71-1-4]|uniref:fimbria/pilus outer membrane usher protein n=1 Tax=Alcanivorax sp. S71-1-4 TaxID=1177159 RepID=UPI001356C7A9|nr:fimbria/pilus outer membrane usher protein [Alcanivorax sp. S71-1-4]KAF0810334.1 type 1 pili usher protein CsuD [Alcanivorax sp. S71-1-4]